MLPVFLLTLAPLAGCSLFTGNVKPENRVYLSRDVYWQLPGLKVLPGQFKLTQSVQATYGNDVYDLLFQVEKQTDQLVMAAMTPTGQSLLQAVYKDNEVNGSVSPLIGKNLSLAYLVSDFLIAFGDSTQLASALDQAAVRVQQSESSRVLSYKGNPTIRIRYFRNAQTSWPEKVDYYNQALGYRLVITTLIHKPL